MKYARTCIILCIAFLLSSSLQAAQGPVLSYVVEQAGKADIYWADTSGNVIRRIKTDVPQMSSLSWSPDGRFVAYQSNHEGPPNIYVLNIQNMVSQRLTNHEGRSLRPAWSPNGRWIAFVSDRDGAYLDVYRMDTDGSNLRRLTNRGNNWRPGWSPDSQWIAYSSFQDRRGALYIMTADGKGRRQLRQGVSTSSGGTWSPDGKQVAFAAGRELEDGINIRVIDTDTDNPLRYLMLENDVQLKVNTGRTIIVGESSRMVSRWGVDRLFSEKDSQSATSGCPRGGAIAEVYSKCTIYIVNLG